MTDVRRLDLRSRTALVALGAGVAMAAVIFVLVVFAQQVRQASSNVSTAQSAQQSLFNFRLALADQRSALEDYLQSGDAAHLASYHSSGLQAATSEREVGSSPHPPAGHWAALQEAAARWHAWADGVLALGAGNVKPGVITQGAALFEAVQAAERLLAQQLDSQLSNGLVALESESRRLALAIPLLGGLMVLLLLLLWRLHVATTIGPISTLASTAGFIQRGEAASIPELSRTDDVGQLAQALAGWRHESDARAELAQTVTREKEREARTMELLNQAATEMSGLLDPAEIGRVLIQKVDQLLVGAVALFGWQLPGRDDLRFVSRPGKEQTSPPEPPIEEELLGEAVQAGRSLLVEDYQAWEGATGRARASRVHSLLAAPLTVSGRTIGVLGAYTRGEAVLGEHDLLVVSLLAAQAAPALEAARLHTELVQAHDELMRANQELSRASRHKSDFLASMSHELRTPLNAIIGFSELLLDYDEDRFDASRRRTFVSHIHTSGKHLVELINDILDLTRIEAGKTDMRFSTFDLGASASALIKLTEPLARESGLDLEFSCHSPLVIRADEGKVRQILINLLSNAIKFTPRGGRVAVEIWHEQDHVVVSVADTGVGIAREDHERVFEPFDRLGVGERPGQGGTGLGLALTRRLAELHGGHVWVESEPGKGSRFFVELPAPHVTEQPVAAGAAPEGPLVLVVDDDVASAALLTDTLRRAGYRTEVLPDGTRAAREVARLRPFAVTLDVVMPGMDGWEVLRHLKSSAPTREVPVIVVSVIDDRAHGLALGADDYLVKPIDRATLLSAVNRLRRDGRPR